MNEEQKQWISEAKAGDETAEARIFKLYVNRLIALAESRLSPKLARRVDAEDIVQSVMRTFFVRLREDRIVWDDSVDLWALLARITARKVCSQVDYHYADRRTVTKDQSVQGNASCSVEPIDDFARDPTPEEAVMVQELLEQIMEPLKPEQRRIVELRLEGHSFEEISRQVGCSESVARRLNDKIKQSLASNWETL